MDGALFRITDTAKEDGTVVCLHSSHMHTASELTAAGEGVLYCETVANRTDKTKRYEDALQFITRAQEHCYEYFRRYMTSSTTEFTTTNVNRGSSFTHTDKRHLEGNGRLDLMSRGTTTGIGCMNGDGTAVGIAVSSLLTPQESSTHVNSSSWSECAAVVGDDVHSEASAEEAEAHVNSKGSGSEDDMYEQNGSGDAVSVTDDTNDNSYGHMNDRTQRAEPEMTQSATGLPVAKRFKQDNP